MEASEIIACCAVFISVISLGTSLFFGWCAVEHNRKSVLPIPYLDRSDYEDKIMIRIFNKGTGPLIIRNLMASHPNGDTGNLIDIVPKRKDVIFSNFSRITEERTIPPTECNDLLVLNIDTDNDVYLNYRQELRKYLKDLTLEIGYTDVYGTKFQTYKANFKWFGRHFEG